MNKKLLLLVLLIFSLLTSAPAGAHSFIMGTIKFPRTISNVPMIRVYCGGRIISCAQDHTHGMLTFSIPRFNNKFQFDILVTPQISFSSTGNTVDYLKVPEQSPNKLFHAALIPKFQETGGQGKLAYQWRIIEDRVALKDGKVPDEAIVICFDPNWVELLAGSNEFELPTISIKPDVLKLCGSEAQFHERSAQLLLCAINSDTVHDASTNQAIKKEPNRIIIAAPIT